ncbi:mechanosensitive ion channel family protein [Oscillatoria salina]|uniref:mechanosensitive ion channel family protein n=1 Tax=Oscillatoria salina TaxID=331517 RepID=UPI0013BC68C6|nr:mechanosensitive ion channel [Oscillatoria salina]MBZ8182759.1 mechanosensitive ion channel [Oscillatoria salina IIICB1]NET89436.1 mechanosensitive ion channel [Kamptonema sp. SIO1D9]
MKKIYQLLEVILLIGFYPVLQKFLALFSLQKQNTIGIITHRSWRKQGSKKSYILIVIAVFFLTTVSPGLTQDEAIPVQSAPNGESLQLPSQGLYFADVLVRGRPVFQVGSLSDLSAQDRAQIINRRLASILSQSDPVEQVTVNPDNPRQIATLQLNNRVLMTVTQQDAEDFGLSVEELAEKWANQLNQTLDKPPLAIDVGQRVYITVRDLLRDTINNLPSLIGAIAVVLLTWLVAKIARRLFRVWAEQTEGNRNTEILIGRLGYGGVWIVGSVIALGVLGLDFGALLGALGLTSVAIGFSLKDVLSNYISGVILLAARPFGINDQVVIGDYEGTIIQIELRATTMKTYDGRMVYIPNQEVFEASIINNTASPKRRSSVIVGIDYGENISQAQQIIFQALSSVSQVESTPEPEILVRELAASTVNLEVRFWVDSRRSGFLKTTSLATKAIKEALERANIDMPTDIYTLMFRNSAQVAIANNERQETLDNQTV